MKTKLIFYVLGLLLVLGLPVKAKISVGLINKSSGSYDDGYVLFTHIASKDIYLINKCGFVVNKWQSIYSPGFETALLPNGLLMHTIFVNNPHFPMGGSGGGIEFLDWNSKVIWRYKISSEKFCQHHDAYMLPNGNILTLVWDKKSFEECVENGRDPDKTPESIYNEKIIEIKPIGKDSAEIVWEWSAWDHLVQANDSTKQNYGKPQKHPELLDANYHAIKEAPDWLHCNSLDYNEKLDQILISSAFFSEVWVIDHSTTTDEAKGHSGGKYGKGGDLLYRWGNSNAYGYGLSSERVFTTQHNAHWLHNKNGVEGDIILFNNKCSTDPKQYISSIDIFSPPLEENGTYKQSLPYGPDSCKFRLKSDSTLNFYSINLSGVDYLPNGNMLICSGANGRFFELDTNLNKVWEYVNPTSSSSIIQQGLVPLMNMVFRAYFYPSNYPGFIDKNLEPNRIIEGKNENSEMCDLHLNINDITISSNINVFPNPCQDYLIVESVNTIKNIFIFDSEGKFIKSQNGINRIEINGLPDGLYYIQVEDIYNIIQNKSFLIIR